MSDWNVLDVGSKYEASSENDFLDSVLLVLLKETNKALLKRKQIKHGSVKSSVCIHATFLRVLYLDLY